MLIEKSVNISTKHARALSGAKHQTSLAHVASLLLNNASQDLQLSVQLSLTFHRKRKRKTWRQWSETKLTQCNVTKLRGENLILFYFMFRCRFQLEVKNKKLSNQTGRNALSERRRAAAALRKMKWNARLALTWTQTLPAKLERQRSEGQTRIRLLCFRQTMNN